MKGCGAAMRMAFVVLAGVCAVCGAFGLEPGGGSGGLAGVYTNKAVIKAPGRFSGQWKPGWAWPSGDKGNPGAATLSPRYDGDGSIILGGPYRQLLDGGVEVTDSVSGRKLAEGRDYAVNYDWAQIASIGDAMGEPGTGSFLVEARFGMQRIDLVQRDRSGKHSVVEGVPSLLCPVRPVPDAGHVAVAGIYIAPEMGGVYPVSLDSPVVPPQNPEAAVKTRRKLMAGDRVCIAFVGDSITLGAEAGKWWEDDSGTYRGRVMGELRRRFPDADIAEMQIFRGGRGIEYVLDAYRERTKDAKPDLAVIGIGINDAHSKDGVNPAVPPEEFREGFRRLLREAAEGGTEVIVHTSIRTNPFAPDGDAGRWDAYRGIIKGEAALAGAGVADTCAAWDRQNMCGTPSFSQLHNWINHPGAEGHKLLADCILGFFGN